MQAAISIVFFVLSVLLSTTDFSEASTSIKVHRPLLLRNLATGQNHWLKEGIYNPLNFRGGSSEALDKDESDDGQSEVDDYSDSDKDDSDYGYDSKETTIEVDEDYEGDYDDEEENRTQKIPAGSFDEPYFMTPSIQLYTAFGCMMLSKRVDLFNPKVVRMVRFAFILQILVQQLFIIYIRIAAKKRNDRTPITVQNPITGALQSQLESNGGASNVMKSLASSFLSSETTVMEYDMKQAKSMQGGVFFNMAFMWFLHFKMDQVQPLLIQAVTGMMQMIYNPLFQIYILGRNLERPFKSQGAVAHKSRNTRDETSIPSLDDPENEATDSSNSNESVAFDDTDDRESDEEEEETDVSDNDVNQEDLTTSDN